MTAPARLPYGSWPSPIAADWLAQGVATPNNVWADGDAVWWSESRPSEGGRCVLLRDGQDVWPGVSVRTWVHSYGGGAWWPDGAGGVYASDDVDGRLWRIPVDGSPVAVTPEPPFPHAWRYADGRAHDGGAVCVREDHTGDGEAVNQLVHVQAGEVQVVASGADFYAWPRPSSDGSRLAWIQWNHPNMPWDRTELWVDGVRQAAGASLVQPCWAPDGPLYVVCDRDGWWNLYRLADDELQPVAPMNAELHRPAWSLDDPDYAVCGDRSVVAAATRGSLAELVAISPDTGETRPLDFGFTAYRSLRAAGPDSVVAIAASPTREPAVVRIHVPGGEIETLRPARTLELDPAFISEPRAISLPTTGGETTHALFYPPANPTAQGPAGELPPLLVLSHGGPTGAARGELHLGVQYWTSRGIAVVDVNYRGSTGYGTAYRDALKGLWGISDVNDCVAAALHLAETGQVDGQRLTIRGGSAGGYTTLCALAFRDVFAAGASRYGIADLEALAADTHKFEARYMDALVGPYPAAAEEYRKRSPIHHMAGFTAPMIVLQGADDPVVPPNQAEMIVAALQQRSVPVAYLLFQGEQHGFRQAANIVTALQAELSFFSQILGFEPADEIPVVELRRGLA